MRRWFEKFRRYKREDVLHSGVLSRKQGARCFPSGADARERLTGLTPCLSSLGLQKDPCIVMGNHTTTLFLHGKVGQHETSKAVMVGKLGSLGYSALRERKGVWGDREQREGKKEGWEGRREWGMDKMFLTLCKQKHLCLFLFSTFGFMEDFAMGWPN